MQSSMSSPFFIQFFVKLSSPGAVLGEEGPFREEQRRRFDIRFAILRPWFW